MARSPFKFIDTSNSRALTTDLARKLANEKVAIVGVGGSGSYVLDLVAKTWVREIVLFDDDVFKQHNAFRAPGAFSRSEVEAAATSKAVFFCERYSRMRDGIRAVEKPIGESNVSMLAEFDTVFLCIDGGPVKRQILDTCEAAGNLLVDCGMGIYRAEPGGPLMGTLRVSTFFPEHHDHAPDCIDFVKDGALGEYERNAQMAELNALNATLAVIKWKKLRGFYSDLGNELDCKYVLDGNRLINSFAIDTCDTSD
ncbi:MAG: ThiF family adenylyltransferase [Gammaproteobacteria bacterium]|nr:ThiF family adenylyltransferase [Gammaproteobacteria bacterium]